MKDCAAHHITRDVDVCSVRKSLLRALPGTVVEHDLLDISKPLELLGLITRPVAVALCKRCARLTRAMNWSAS